jgi:hypothetical protein
VLILINKKYPNAMKNIMFTLLAGAFLLLIPNDSYAQPPNGDFESWVTDAGGNLNPEFWQTMNDTPTVSVHRYSPGNSGNYAMRVTPIDAGISIPGVAFLEFSVNTRPTSLKGYIRSNIPSGDEAVIYIMFYKDTNIIAYPTACTFRIDTSYSNYTEFILPITYTTGETPDSCTLVIVAGKSSNPDLATEITIDDLIFSTASSDIPSVEATFVSCYPNPASDISHISFALPEASPVTFEIRDLQGKMVLIYDAGTQQAGSQEMDIPVDGLASGTYTMNMVGNGWRVSRKLNILH